MKVFLNPSTELDIERMTAPINGMSYCVANVLYIFFVNI